MKFTSIHKKTRGMRKKARNLARWSEHHKELDIDSLIRHRKDYVKIWIDPFYRLYQITPNKIGKKNPKHRFQKQILYQLLDIYSAWQKKLDELDQPYYLKIWIGDPEFMDSQVVAALEPEIDYYSKLFRDKEQGKEFPLDIRHPLMEYFKWERCWNGYYIWESDLDTVEEIQEVQHKAIEISETFFNGRLEKSYFIPAGDMWIGSIKKSKNAIILKGDPNHG